jgi:hypothetical protein
MLEYNLGKILEKKVFHFISFYKVRDWSVFVKMNVMYMCIQKHKYTPKKLNMISSLYESLKVY